MSEQELNEITENTIVIHKKYNREYKVRDKHIRIKNSTTGEWEDGITYVPQYPNKEKLFTRNKTSFLEEFILKKED